MSNSKPYIVVATTCENVLIEKDNVISLIRLVDLFTIHQKPPPAASLPMKAFISLRAGELRGPFVMKLRIRTPNGEVREVPESFPVVFNEEARAANVFFTFGIPAQAGTYWIDLLWQEELLTSFPVSIVIAESAAPTEPDKN
jgi:hypothetical protein